MKVQDLIQELLPYKDRNLDVVIVDGQETFVSGNFDVCLTPDYLVDSIDNKNAEIQDKYITAIPHNDDNVIGEVVYLRIEDFYLETDYWVNKGSITVDSCDRLDHEGNPLTFEVDGSHQYPSYNGEEWQGEDDDIDDDIERESEGEPWVEQAVDGVKMVRRS